MIIVCRLHRPVVGLADVVEASLVLQNLLEDEGRHRLAQLRTRFHYSKQS